MPYSGKTTFAGYLSETKGYPHLGQDAMQLRHSVAVANSAELRTLFKYREALTEERYHSILQAHLFQFYADDLVWALRTNSGVVADSADFISRRNREYFVNLVKRAKPSIEAYWMEADLETCLQRHMAHRAAQSLWFPGKREGRDVREPITESLLMEWYNISTPPDKKRRYG